MNDRCAAVASNLAELRWSQGYVHIFLQAADVLGDHFSIPFKKLKLPIKPDTKS